MPEKSAVAEFFVVFIKPVGVFFQNDFIVTRGKMVKNLLEYANRIIVSIFVFIRSTKENIT